MVNKKWSILNRSHPIIQTVIDRWSKLLKENHPEKEYHDFIKRHANLFFADAFYSFFSISKLKLGSEFELDFAIPYENRSQGFVWELVELKRPDTPPFLNNGVPSAKLTEAAQQIRDWKYWIQNSRSEAKKVFSLWSVRTIRNPNFIYTIIIGNRENSEKWLTQRNQYADENRINIRSFEYLTDCLRQKKFDDKAYLADGDFDKKHPNWCIELANPFIESFTDSQWKRFLKEPKVSGPHFISNSCESLLQHWTINQDLFQSFLKLG